MKLPRLTRHTHLLNDQGYSRWSVKLNKTDCRTVEDFISVLREGLTPTPNIQMLERTLDIHSWIGPCLQDHINFITQPQQFLFEHCDVHPVQAGMRTSMRSHLPLSDSTHLLKRLPDGKPLYNAGKPIFSTYDNPCVEAAAEKMKKAEEHLDMLTLQKHLGQWQKASWDKWVAKWKDMEQAPASPYPQWWPLTPEDVRDAASDLTPQNRPCERTRTCCSTPLICLPDSSCMLFATECANSKFSYYCRGGASLP